MSFAKTLISIFLLSGALHASAQNNAQKAKDLGAAAIKLEDDGKYDEALPLLDEASKLDPGNYNYPYEVVYCYVEKKENKKALEAMLKVMAYNGIQEECYQMLGNIYDEGGDSAMALKTYADGIAKFPNAGRLYLETGNVFFQRRQYNEAMAYYEKGIEVAPDYPSNYYRAAQIYTASTEAIWGMMYGELFMNLERNSKRTAIMSKWLYDTYKQDIVIVSKDSMQVHFCKNTVMTVDEKALQNPKIIRMPFSMVYEPMLLLSLVGADSISTETLCNMRSSFIDHYYEQGYDKMHPNVLFEYEHTMAKAGVLDAYNHWILMKGDEAAFSRWQQDHTAKWNDFLQWFKNNPIKVTTENEFTIRKA